MINPIFWLVLSFLLVSVSLTAVLVVLVPAVVELSRAARSFEKLCDTLDRDLPPTLESIRQTTTEMARLTDDVNASVQQAGRVAQQVDQSVTSVRSQAKRAQVGTRSLMAGMGAAWATLTKPEPPRDRSPRKPTSPRRSPTYQTTPPSPVTAPLSRGSASTHRPQNAPPPTANPGQGAADAAAIAPTNRDPDDSAPNSHNLDKSSTVDPQVSPETP